MHKLQAGLGASLLAEGTVVKHPSRTLFGSSYLTPRGKQGGLQSILGRIGLFRYIPLIFPGSCWLGSPDVAALRSGDYAVPREDGGG